MAPAPWKRGRGGRFVPKGKKNTKKRAQPSESASDSDGDARKKVRWNQDVSERSRPDGESEDDEPERFQVGQTSLAVTCNRSRIGCAYFNSTNGIIYLLEDTQDGVHYDFVKQLLEHVNPDFLLVSSKADESFITVCRVFMEEKQGNCQVRPHREFIASKGKDKLYSLPLFTDQAQLHDSSTMASSDSGPTRSKEAYNFLRGRDRQQMADADAVRWQASIRIANFVEAERSPLCMACVNALLEQIHRTRAFGELDTDTYRIVNNIEILRLDQYMQINMDALLSLQIFEEQHHASMHSDKTKEGLSLFGTLNYTKTRAGYDLLRQWFLRPSLSLETINERHTAVECFLRADNLSVCGALRTHLKGVRNVPHMLTAMQRGRAEARDWETLCKFAFHAAMLADSLEELAHGDDVAIVQKLKECLDTADFKVMGEEVNSTIDWEASALNQRVCVRPLIDPELDQYKELYDGLDSFMNHVSAQVAMEVSADVVPALNVVYFPQIGFLICVPKPEGWRREEPELGPPDWTYSFHTEESVYLKSDKMHDVDHHIGDIQTMIAERELEIVHALYERIVPYAPAVGAACNVMAELDCLLSFAQASLIHGYIRPTMTDENVLAIRGGRHPLHEQVVDTFIPNDSFLVGGIGIGVAAEDEDATDNADDGGDDGILQQTERSVMVITGANACGKSVYLKQVALLQFMAQIGCFVPVESATIGLVDKIFTRVQARESISKIQSSFMLDLNQVSLALRNSTARSLILLDEFGKGTLDTDGAGLLVGVLRHLLGRGANCPRVLATTHFRDVFRADIVPPSLPLLLAHMRVMLVREEGADGIVYLYKVAPGLSLESHAAKCAAVCGLPKPVADRAQYVTELITRHEVGAILDEQMTPAEEEELREVEAVLKRFAAWNIGARSVDPRQGLRDVLAVGQSENISRTLGHSFGS